MKGPINIAIDGLVSANIEQHKEAVKLIQINLKLEAKKQLKKGQIIQSKTYTNLALKLNDILAFLEKQK